MKGRDSSVFRTILLIKTSTKAGARPIMTAFYCMSGVFKVKVPLMTLQYDVVLQGCSHCDGSGGVSCNIPYHPTYCVKYNGNMLLITAHFLYKLSPF